MISRRLCILSATCATLATVACTSMSQGQPTARPPASPQASSTGTPMLGFSTFPFDATPAAYDKLYQLGRDYGQIYVVQRDNGIAWKEALNNEPLPANILNEWADFKKHRPAGQPMYLAIAPLEFDRTTLAGACPGSSVPSAIKGAAFDSTAVKTAYLNYCRTAVNFFNPDYLNIGVEAGELAHRKPSQWPAFARLIEHVRSNLKQEFPNLKIGISFGLQSLMEPAAAELAKPLVESCDYLGLSFYPYMSDFHEKFGSKALPAPPNEWTAPLEWARNYTSKPIAICETGYNSNDISWSPSKINLKGNTANQTQYVKDLARIATRDNYLFVVWYFPVDLDRILATLPEGGGAAILWERNGLFDKDLKPKPALQAWQDALEGKIDQTAPTETVSVAGSGGLPTAGGTVDSGNDANVPVASLSFDNQSDMFSAPAGATVGKADETAPDGRAAMQWAYSYKKKQWAWASKSIGEGKLARATNVSFWVKSDSSAPLIIQLKESNGETHSFQVTPGSSWTKVSVNFSSLAVDQSSKKDGVFDPSRVTEIVLADGAATSGKKGSRQVVFSRWDFR